MTFNLNKFIRLEILYFSIFFICIIYFHNRKLSYISKYKITINQWLVSGWERERLKKYRWLNCSKLKMYFTRVCVCVCVCVYIYIYIVIQTDCFVSSQLLSVAREAGHFKLGLKPAQLC